MDGRQNVCTIFSPVRSVRLRTGENMVVPLCNDCHTMGANAVHSAGGVEIMKDLKGIAQSIYEETHSRQHWMMNIGRNYLKR